MVSMGYLSVQNILRSTPQLRYVLRLAHAPSPHRSFSSSSPARVFRPQEPYPYTLPKIDDWGHANKDPDREVDEEEPKIDIFLSELAESPRVSWTEKYGSHDGFGLKNKPRYYKTAEGKLIHWDAAGADWKQATGYYEASRESVPRYARLEFPDRRRAIGDGPLQFIRDKKAFQEVLEEEEQQEGARVAGGSDISLLNLEAWEKGRQQRVSTFFKRKPTAAQRDYDRKVRKFLERVHEKEAADRAIEGPRRDRDDEDDIGKPSIWEQGHTMEETPDGPDRQEMAALPPSERRRLDERISQMPTYGREEEERPKRLAWGEREPSDRPWSSDGNYTQRKNDSSPLTQPVIDKRRRPFGVRSYSTSRKFDDGPDHQSPPPSQSPADSGEPSAQKRPWQPFKKLSFAAMEGVKMLHRQDPVRFNHRYLSKEFGVSYEAITRILRSKFRETAKGRIENEPITSTSIDGLAVDSTQRALWREPRSSSSGRNLNKYRKDVSPSPVPTIVEAFARKEEMKRARDQQDWS